MVTVHEVENPRVTCSWPSVSMDSAVDPVVLLNLCVSGAMQIKPVVVRGSTVPQNSTCDSLSVAVWNLKIHQQAYHIGTFKSVGLSCVLTGSFIHTLFFKILCIDTFKNIGSLSTG